MNGWILGYAIAAVVVLVVAALARAAATTRQTAPLLGEVSFVSGARRRRTLRVHPSPRFTTGSAG